MKQNVISSDDRDFLISLSREAGSAILQIYNSENFDVDYKDDKSPFTEADRRSHRIIDRKLRDRWPAIPVISEEQQEVRYSLRSTWRRFWLVDPLDGTKEFIKRNGEFTVNIALVEDRVPVFGVIFAPCLNELYYSLSGEGSFRIGPDSTRERLSVATVKSDKRLGVMTSASHASQRVRDYMNAMAKRGYHIEEMPMGSSLKFCRLAEGRAQVYPRFGATMEWDIAAGHLIVEEAGGEVVDVKTGLRPVYNKESLLNNDFIALCQNSAMPNFGCA